MQFNFFSKSENNNDDNDIKKEIIRELLHMTRKSYNLALGITAASALMTLFGVGLFYFDKVSEASLTASGGVLTTLASVQHTKQKKEELCEMLNKLAE
ncbi:hypothetical protein [Calothrix sp. PCC 7507]|uniref:TRADD-N-associated membrane domain-containing protein n=1 Tax=Calothrix sp. PCC 7507 TaxID=99598 RepID=UPI00029F4A2F|nr:hypothetical protein [Calothrix sp. PCC 7507]AFY36251.1 hypothetical protein Cal7507_5939 [Calothrix sp. PCC 7507]